MDNDRYKELGNRLRWASLDECLRAVRINWPNCYMEGSMGRERSFWVMNPEWGMIGEPRSELIGHAWPVKRHPSDFWVRIKLRNEI